MCILYVKFAYNKRKPVDKKIKKRKKNPVKTLKRKAWEAFARYVRRIHPICVTCKKRATHDAGHFLRNSERNQNLGGNALWYDLRNFGGQCTTCNSYNGGEQAAFTIYVEEKYGFGIVQELNTLLNTPKKWTVEELKALYEHYKESVETLS